MRLRLTILSKPRYSASSAARACSCVPRHLPLLSLIPRRHWSEALVAEVLTANPVSFKALPEVAMTETRAVSAVRAGVFRSFEEIPEVCQTAPVAEAFAETKPAKVNTVPERLRSKAVYMAAIANSDRYGRAPDVKLPAEFLDEDLARCMVSRKFSAIHDLPDRWRLDLSFVEYAISESHDGFGDGVLQHKGRHFRNLCDAAGLTVAQGIERLAVLGALRAVRHFIGDSAQTPTLDTAALAVLSREKLLTKDYLDRSSKSDIPRDQWRQILRHDGALVSAVPDAVLDEGLVATALVHRGHSTSKKEIAGVLPKRFKPLSRKTDAALQALLDHAEAVSSRVSGCCGCWSPAALLPWPGPASPSAS